MFFWRLVRVAGHYRFERRLIIDVENEGDAERFEDIVLFAFPGAPVVEVTPVGQLGAVVAEKLDVLLANGPRIVSVFATMQNLELGHNKGWA